MARPNFESYTKGMVRCLCAALLGTVACGTADPSGAPQTTADGGGADGPSGMADARPATDSSVAGPDAAGDAGEATDSSTATGDADATAKTNCTSEHLAGCYRGMYLSLYSDGVGQIVFGGATEPYRRILGDTTKEANALAFIGAHRIESLSLYDLGDILADPGLSVALLSFLDRAQAMGVVEVNAIGDATQGAWDAIAAMQASHAPFDGIVTEIEFWNAGTTFQQFTDTVSYVRSLGMKTRTGASVRVGAYIGWPTEGQVDAMLPLVDRLYVHVYVTSPDLAYAYGQTRFQYIAAGNAAQGTAVDVWPIFSAEGATWSAGTEHFMGDWLSMHTLDEAEATFLTGWEGHPPGPGVRVTGFQYYEGFFMQEYVK
jgi:hypothetical protein